MSNVLDIKTAAPVVAVLSEAEQRIKEIDDVIKGLGPELATEVQYVRDRLHYFLNRHGQAGVLAVMRVNFEIAAMAGK